MLRTRHTDAVPGFCSSPERRGYRSRRYAVCHSRERGPPTEVRKQAITKWYEQFTHRSSRCNRAPAAPCSSACSLAETHPGAPSRRFPRGCSDQCAELPSRRCGSRSRAGLKHCRCPRQRSSTAQAPSALRGIAAARATRRTFPPCRRRPAVGQASPSARFPA